MLRIAQRLKSQPLQDGVARSLPRRLAKLIYAQFPARSQELLYLGLGPLAQTYRHTMLRHVTFIGITGSSGKTTTKDLLAAALGSKTTKSLRNWNNRLGVARAMLLARPNRAFHVQEMALGALQYSLDIVRPKVAVVTVVGTDHLSQYGSIDNIAREKSTLVEAVPQDGVAMLNADDPRVAAMASVCRGRVVTFGCSDGADFRAEHVQADWPDRLSFELVHRGTRQPVRTQLIGELWLVAVLAAIATAVTLGVPLAEAVARIERVPPQRSRMEVIDRDDGVTFVCDLMKAPLWHFDTTLDFVRAARAARKILVVGTISDYKQKSTTAYSRLAQRALDVADMVIFVGPHAHRTRKALQHAGAERLHALADVEEAARFLGGVLSPGDFVFLKGSLHADNLRPLTEVVRSSATNVPTPVMPPPSPAVHSALDRRLLIVGLGNARADLHDTPHNIGWKVVDLLAATKAVVWESTANGSIAQLPGEQAVLVKLSGVMNQSGETLCSLASDMGYDPAHCLIVHDDIDFNLGEARVVETGGDAGHRGIRSLIKSLKTRDFARVRVGVGRSTSDLPPSRYVITPFPASLRDAVEAACRNACQAVLTRLEGSSAKAKPPSRMRQVQAASADITA